MQKYSDLQKVKTSQQPLQHCHGQHQQVTDLQLLTETARNWPILFSSTLLQVISTSPQDSTTIESHGGDRIELVSALEIGGITPSQALVRKCLEAASISTMVMVRHHNQGFVLNDDQRKLLVEEAALLVEMGCRGIVVGAVTEQKRVDERLLEMLADQVPLGKIDVTFHKAADQTDLLETYQTLQRHKIRRVLTQGGVGKLEENVEVLQKLISINSVNTLLGGGVSFNNISWIIDQLQPSEIHIGTCVRQNKYGAVNGKLLQDFISLMSKQ